MNHVWLQCLSEQPCLALCTVRHPASGAVVGDYMLAVTQRIYTVHRRCWLERTLHCAGCVMPEELGMLMPHDAAENPAERSHLVHDGDI